MGFHDSHDVFLVRYAFLWLSSSAASPFTECCVLQVYAGVMLLITYGLAQIWLGLVQMLLVIVKNATLFGLILTGAVLFDRAVHSRRSDMENLVRGYEALVSTFRKISFMLVMTLTLSLVIDIVRLV